MDASAELERVKRELNEARRQLEQAEQERHRERQRAEQAEKEKQQAEKEKQQAEEQARETTLAEYIQACHDLIFTGFAVETDEALTSKGTTKVTNKRCPTRLEPWTDFREEQRAILGTLFATFSTQKRAFENLYYLRTRGQKVAKGKVGDEERLKFVLQDLLVEPVTLIMERFQEEDDIQAKFDIGTDIKFENRVGALGGAPHGYAQWPMTPDAKKLQPDQICTFRQDKGDSTGRTMAYVMEYKPPHKITLQHLRLGLRSMNIYEDVVNRATKPVEEEEEALFQYHADRLAAAVVTQTFDYMIEAGLTHGFLTTGEAIVFLKVDWTDPTTLYYYLAEPGPEVDEDRDDILYRTAVSQVLAFTVLALSTRQEHRQDDRQRLTKDLNTWKEDWESILRSIPPSERIAPPTSPAYIPSKYEGVKRSPYHFRQTKARTAGRQSCQASSAGRGPSPEGSDDDEDGTRAPDTPTPQHPRKRGLARRPRGGSGGTGGSGGGGGGGGSSSQSRPANRQYCTQKCLLGLMRGGFLDENCPNVILHRGEDPYAHPVDHATWLSLLREQLRRTLDDGIVRLGKYGARGVLFQVTLLSLGYTFVSKATVAGLVPELEHEAKVYGHLEPLQGVNVPVFLGATDLRDIGRTYYYDFGVRLIYLMFLSWGGVSLAEVAVPKEGRDKVQRDVVLSVRALHMHGVAHTDVRAANVLLDKKTGQVMVIDFEQAVLLPRPRPALSPVVPNKRAPCVGSVEATFAGQQNSNTGLNRLLQDDIFAANVVF
ncbi:hypothetical protein B0T16DRAFT_451104 [Cercophora newfieldiana]|uniref:Protein kinase domain-containing protein n=1 Tax=Cercophora newfieldiana TaxID=92897 RepID=A0AA40CYQ5_9PEZI|nr:hypothetical protein B0T16DRAFT_451104 [Cercophora newfieldiana]